MFQIFGQKNKRTKKEKFYFSGNITYFYSFVLLSESLWNTRQHQTIIPCTRAMSACRYSVTPVLKMAISL